MPVSRRAISSTLAVNSLMLSRLFVNRRGQLAPGLRRQTVALFDEAARRSGDDRERRAQIVRDGRQQRVAQLLRRHADFGFLRDFDEVDALECERDLRGERIQQAALLGHEDQPFVARREREYAAIAHRRAQRNVVDRRYRQACRCRARPAASDRVPTARPRDRRSATRLPGRPVRCATLPRGRAAAMSRVPRTRRERAARRSRRSAAR